MHRKRLGNEADGCVTVGSLEPFSEQAVEDVKADEMEDVGARRICEGTMKTGLEGFYHRKLFRGDEAVQCPVLKNLELTAAETERREKVSEKISRYDLEQQATIARPQSKVEYYKELADKSDK